VWVPALANWLNPDAGGDYSMAIVSQLFSFFIVFSHSGPVGYHSVSRPAKTAGTAEERKSGSRAFAAQIPG
jgi:hypothetical protein